MANALEQGCRNNRAVRVIAPVQANLVFVELPSARSVTRLRESGVRFAVWISADKPIIRLVTSFRTTISEIDGFVSSLNQCLAE
jgi:threonine aldolase